MDEQITGSCLCGAVTYGVRGPFAIFQYCYCSRCRKITGSSQAANLFVPPDRFQWLRGEESVRRFEHPDAKYFATSFCTTCGSALPWHTKGGKNVVVPAGTLDGDPGIRPAQNVFCGSKASWYADPSTLPNYEELPE